MNTYNARHCSLEPALEETYSYDSYSMKGQEVVFAPIVASGAEWIDSFLRDMRECGDLDCSDAIIDEWQAKFDEMGLPYNCVHRELDFEQLTLDRATKYFNNESYA